MSSEATELQVVLTLPPAPLVLADSGFLTTLAAVEQEVASLKVSDPVTAQAAANLQIKLTSTGTALEKTRKELKQPFIEAGRQIDAAAKAPLDRIEAAKVKLKAELTAFDNEQRRLAYEAEQKRQAEIRRLETIAAAERAEAARKQAEIDAAARSAAVPTEDFDAPDPVPTATEKAIEAARIAPPAVVAKPTGITFKTTLTATVVDVSKLPDIYVERTPKLRAIQVTFCNGWREGQPIPEVPGVKFEVNRTTVSTGR